MPFRLAGCAALLLLVLTPSAWAQEPAPDRRDAPAAVDVARLPVDLGRINRGLQRSAAAEDHTGLNLRYYLDVYGRAPRLDLLDQKRDNLLYGPVPYGAPTHQQMLEIMTPREYRAPAMDLNALMRWLADRAKAK